MASRSRRQKRADRHPAPALVGRVDVLVAARVVELLGARPDEDVLVRHLAEVDLGSGDAERRADTGGMSLMYSSGSPSAVMRFTGPTTDAVAVRVLQVLVDPLRSASGPGRARQVLVRELARRQHDLRYSPSTV